MNRPSAVAVGSKEGRLPAGPSLPLARETSCVFGHSLTLAWETAEAVVAISSPAQRASSAQRVRPALGGSAFLSNSVLRLARGDRADLLGVDEQLGAVDTGDFEEGHVGGADLVDQLLGLGQGLLDGDVVVVAEADVGRHRV